MGTNRKRLVIWFLVVAFAAVGQVLSAEDHDPAEGEGDWGAIKYCTVGGTCDCCTGKWWSCSGRHSENCLTFGCPNHNFEFCNN
jgi:hypothetical protein